MLTRAPKGTRDILPAEIGRWQHVERLFAETCRRFGYAEIRVPTFEHTELFQRGVGDTTDIVQKEMYTFPDKAGRSLSLRPEGTAGVVRSYIENGMASLPAPVKLFYMLTAFRYENVQKGRYREFHQFGVEAFGAAGPEVDAEIIGLLAAFFRSLGLRQTSLRINSIGCPDCRTAYHGILRDYLEPRLEGLCRDCRNRFDRNPLRILDCKEERCRQATTGAPALLDHLDAPCRDHFDRLRDALSTLDIAYSIDKGIVRGLDYYTRTVFEFVSDHVGTQGTICGGGRYDGLVEACGGAPTPGMGFGLGVERLLMELDAQGVSQPGNPGPDLYLAPAGDGARPAAARLAQGLRERGVSVETDLCGRSLKAQMKYAGKIGARRTVVLGDDELASGRVRIRDMATGAEEEAGLDELAGSDVLAALLVAP